MASVTNVLGLDPRIAENERTKTLGSWRLNEVNETGALEGLKATPPDCLDVVITSPPYWGQRQSNGIGCEEDPREFVRNLVEILAEAMRCLKPSGTLWLNIGDSYNTPINWRETDHRYSSLGAEGTGLSPDNQAYTKRRPKRLPFIKKETGWLQYGNLLDIPHRVVIGLSDLGFLYRGEVIWEKSRPLPEGRCRRPHRRHEGIYIMAKDEQHNFRTKPPVGSVWKLTQTPSLLPHCSTFPIDLPIQCIKAADLQGRAIVCDPFMGSGTTGKAALRMGHDFLGFEIDPAHCKVANESLNDQGRLLF